MKLGEGFIEVRPDTSKFKTELATQTTADASAVSRQLGQALAGGLFLAGAKKATDAASQLEQAVGGTAAVFHESAGEVEAWAKTAAEAAGLSERAARELTSQIGGLLKGFNFTEGEAADLSIQLAQLGADLAATFGGNPEDAVIALGAALRGETDPLERFGIALNQTLVNQRAVDEGLASSTTKVDQHAKAQATLSLIMERSADAQGQFAREADSAAGQAAISAAKTENSAADLGESLLPIYSKINEVVGLTADGFAALPEPVQTGVVALAGVAALSGPIKTAGEAVGSLATIARTKLSSGMETAGLRALYLRDNLGKVALGAGIAGGAVGLMAIAFLSAKNDADQLRQAAAELRQEAEATGKTLEEVAIAKLAREFADSDQVTDAMDDLGVSFQELGTQVRGSEGDFKAWADQLYASAGGNQKLRTEAQTLEVRVRRLREELGEAEQVTGRQAEAEKALGVESEETAPKLDKVTTAAEEQTDALNDLLEATLAQFDSNIGYRQSLDEVEDKLAKVLYLTNAGKTGTEDYRDALLEAEDALLGQADAALRLYEDTATANGETLNGEQRTAIYKQELIKLADELAPGSPLRKRLEEYIFTLGAVPSEVHTSVVADYGTQGRPFVSSGVKRFAAGGDVMDGLFQVHEGEVLRKEGSSVEVIAGAPSALGGGVFYTTINLWGATGESPADTLTRSARRIGEEVATRA